MRLEYITATGEHATAYVGKSNPEFTRVSAFPDGTKGPITLRWDGTAMVWREMRLYGFRAIHAARAYPELKILAEQRAWAEFDCRAGADGVTIVERGQSWMPAPDGFPGTEMLEVWGLT